MTELHDLSALELLKAYTSRKLSPVEVVDDVVAHIGRWEPRLNALYAPDFAAARREARKSEARWKKGKPVGPLDGVPITIKENLATKGLPVPLGTAATTLVPAAMDAPPAARVRAAGAIILSKTTMPDYGMLSSGLSSFHPLTRNPWDLTKNPGGSSSGAGAAAAGYGPLHLGTDIGGSVRLPAAWCGIFTLKPSLGRVPIDPPYVGRVAGPMTRTVADSALLMSVLSTPDPRDFMSLPPADIDWMKLDRRVKGLRIGLQMEAGFGLPVDPEVATAVRAAARAFARAGAVVTPMKPFMTREIFDGLDDFWRARSWDDIVRLPPETRATKILPFITAWARKAVGMTALDVMRGFNRVMEMRKLAVAASLPFDYVLSPTAPIPAYPAELPCPTNDSARPLEHIGFTVPWNMSEQPAASINCGYTKSGLPVGLQIVGRRFDDIGVLRVARWYERARPAQRPWPAP
ncbi:MAG: amidase [Rhodospirillales bacterium]|nr:amidase [Rhodospirillales bacterium]